MSILFLHFLQYGSTISSPARFGYMVPHCEDFLVEYPNASCLELYSSAAHLIMHLSNLNDVLLELLS